MCAHRLRRSRFGLISLFLAPILGDSDITEPGMGLPGFTEDGLPYLFVAIVVFLLFQRTSRDTHAFPLSSLVKFSIWS